MGTLGTRRRRAVAERMLAALVAVAMAAFVGYAAPMQAYAGELATGQGATLGTLASDSYLLGGETSVESGEYTLFPGDPSDESKAPATGTIEIAENANVTLIGAGSEVTFKDLNIKVGDGATVTVRNLHAAASSNTSKPVFDFAGKGTLKIAGTNLLEQGNKGGYYAVVRVAPQASVVFDGEDEAILYGYKTGMGAFIGSNGCNSDNSADYPDEASGAMTFKGGTWFLKGSQTGPVIGSDGQSAKGGTITIDGAMLYVKGVAQGALIGSSPQGWAPDVVVNSGLLELFTDYNGSAIGYGGNKNVAVGGGKGSGSSHEATLTINGGSIKTVVSSNGFDSWFTSDEQDALGNVNSVVTDKIVTSKNETALLTFDASKYASQDTVSVYLDGATDPFYSGPLYSWVANEAKNPVDSDGNASTQANWLANSQAWTAIGMSSTFAPDNNLYLYLSKASHTLKVGEDTYSVMWDEGEGTFVTSADKSWYKDDQGAFAITTLSQMLGFAELVNSGTTFEGKTVTLANDIDFSGVSNWVSIGNADNAFAGTFDGSGKVITGLTISSSGSYKGLFGKTASTAVLTDFALGGSVEVAGSADFVGAVAGYNAGSISNVNSSVNVKAEESFNVGGIAGFNDGGKFVDSNKQNSETGGKGAIANCSTSGNVVGKSKVGGIVGENSGMIAGSYSSSTVDGLDANGKNGVGGIVGRNGNNNTAYEAGIVDNCYFIGTVGRSGQKWVGGIAGFNNANSSITNSYMAGALVKGGGFYNAIAGNQEGASSTSNNYALSYDCSGNSEAETGIAKNEAELKSPGMVLLLNGGSAVGSQSVSAQADSAASAWNYDSENINNGYPVLAWQGGLSITAEDVSAAAAAEVAINVIGKVTVDSKAAIDAAKAKFEDLSETQKALVPESAKNALADAQAAYSKAVDDKAAQNAATEKPAPQKPAAEATATAVNAVANGKKVAAGSGASAGTYKVASTASKTVVYTAPKNKNAKSVAVPATVKLPDGKTYKVTSVEAGAFKNMKKLAKVTIGNNVKTVKAKAFNNLPKLSSVVIGTGVTRIAAKAFQNTPKLKTITVKSTKLAKKTSVKGALSGSKLKKPVTVKAPKAKKSAYKKTFTKANLKSPKKVTVK